ncbi:MAG: cell wall-active antibiotics response protein LiaF [Candidatus Zhuqueibacterota bacterium]
MSNTDGTSRGLFWGVILIVIGLLFLFDQWDWLEIGDLWPLIIIAVGVYYIIKSRNGIDDTRRDPSGFGDHSITSDSQQVNFSNSMGDIKVKVTSKKFQDGTIRTTFGTINVDLQDIDIESGESILRLETTFGEIKILPPRNIAFMVDASNTAGDMTIFNEKKSGWRQETLYRTDTFDAAKKRLKISASLVFGDIKVG